jgi:excisionase family DNA binding protein
MADRFLDLHEVADELHASWRQVFLLVVTGELPAIKIGGRGQWRVERSRLEDWIAAKYAEARDRRDSFHDR